jgi:putative transposase
MHQAIKRHQWELDFIEQLKPQVFNYRRVRDHRAGSRSLFHNLGIKSQYGMGTTKFEKLMSVHCITLKKMQVRVVTTKSCLKSRNYQNLLSGLTINGINQAVAGDLTYVYHGAELYYLFMLTDLYSQRIVGMSIGRRQRALDALDALQGWIRLRGKRNLSGCIHHTDGGSQYFSELYVSALAELDVRISVADNCLENGYAEQRNGLVKHHLIPTILATDLETFKRKLERKVYFYNHKRKQKALDWRSPCEYECRAAQLPLEQRPTVMLHVFESEHRQTVRTGSGERHVQKEPN